MRRPLLLLSLLLSLAMLAPPAVAQIASPLEGTDPVADAAGLCDDLDPAHCLFPFPNDAFTTAAHTPTGRVLDLQVPQMPRNIAGIPVDPTDYNRNDGFSPGSLIITKVPGLDTPAAFAHTGAVDLTDLARYADPDAPVVVLDAETGERHPIWTELDANPTSAADVTLLIRPAVNLAEGRRYVVALRNLRDAADAPIGAQPAFAALRDGTDNSDRQTRFDVEVFPALQQAGIARDDALYLAWDFTVASTENLSERMLHIRDDAFAQLGDTDLADLTVEGDSPTIIVDDVTEQLPCRPKLGVPPVECGATQLDGRIMRRVEGRVLVPCYLNQPGCPTGSRFLYADPEATLPTRIPGNMTAAAFTCNIPSEAAEGRTFRPSLYGHGLLGSGGEVNSGKLYELGDDGLLFCATDWIGMSTDDIPNAVSILAELGRFPTLADRVQQGMLNFLYLGRAMIHPDGFAALPAFQVDGRSVIDTSELYYNGGSQGGIIGGALAAVAPDFVQAHLGVPAMNYSTLLRRSVDFDTYAVVMRTSYPDQLVQPLLLSLIQTLWDRAETNGYAHHVTGDPYPNTPDHNVLLNVAFGDHQVTNWASEVMARTIGTPIRTPAIDPSRHPAGTSAYWGIPELAEGPQTGSAVVIGDIGPLREVDGRVRGTTPPPLANVPNREGVDPHGPDASEAPFGYAMIAAFLTPEGTILDACEGQPCYLDGWTGPTR